MAEISTKPYLLRALSVPAERVRVVCEARRTAS